MKKTVLFTVLFFTVFGIFAQAPYMFKYQAALRDANGNVLSNQNVTVDVSLLKDAPDGETVFTETHNVTTTAQGIINLNIGSVSNLKTTDWNSGTYFIKISVDGTELGVSQLLSVPYALSAAGLTVEGENGETYSPTVDETGNVYFESQNITPADKLMRREKFILDNMSYTKYVHSSDSAMDEQIGLYKYDCSGFFCEYVLKHSIPEHYQNMYDVYPAYHPADSRPRAWSFYDYFRDILGQNYDPNDISTCTAQNEYWKVFTSIDSVRRGDIIAVRYADGWRSWYNTNYGEWPSTGHILTVWGPPVLESGETYVYDMKVLDSSLSGHGNDSRTGNVSPDGSGYGHGWMTFRVSTMASKRPYKYKWTPASSNYYELYDDTQTITDYTRIQGIIFARPINN